MFIFRQYREFIRGENIIAAGDLAQGGIDYSAVQFLSRTNLDIPLVYHSKTVAVDMTNKLYPVLEKIYDVTQIRPVVGYERNAGGVFEIERLASLNRLGKYEVFKMPVVARVESQDAVKLGWETNTATRPAMLGQLKEAIDKHLIRIYDEETVKELYSFVVVQTTNSWKAQAEAGSHDDLVMALMGAWYMYQNTTEKRVPSLYRQIPQYQPSDTVIGI